MTENSSKLSPSTGREIFAELSEKDFLSLYNTAQVKHYDEDQVIFQEGQRNNGVLVVLRGKICITGSQTWLPPAMEILGPGTFLCDGSLESHGSRLFSAVALQPSLLLLLTNDQLEALGHGIQNFFLKRLYDRAFSQAVTLARACLDWKSRCDLMSQAVIQRMAQQTQGYTQTEFILGMLRKVPRLPMYASKLTQMLLDEKTSARQIAVMVKDDPSLVSAVLKRVNSGYYRWQKKISDFQHAVMLLGFNQVYQLVIEDGLRKTMPDTPPFRKLHDHSVVISHLAHEISLFSKCQEATTLSTIALLHDIGKSILLLLKAQNPKLAPLIDTLDASKIGSMLLAEWKIPDIVCKTVAYQDYADFCPPSKLPGDIREGVAVLHTAHVCLESLSRERPDGAPPVHPFEKAYLSTLHIREPTGHQFMKNHLLPQLKKRWNRVPVRVRQFLQSSAARKHDHEGGD